MDFPPHPSKNLQRLTFLQSLDQIHLASGYGYSEEGSTVQDFALTVRLNETFLVGFTKETKTLRLDSLPFEKNGFSNRKPNWCHAQ